MTLPVNDNPLKRLTWTVSYGFRDRDNRIIGSQLSTFEMTIGANTPGRFFAMSAGRYLWLETRATRNGVPYGPTSSNYFKTDASREAAIAQYLRAATKRAARLAASSNIPRLPC